jgi:hypothetical protein
MMLSLPVRNAGQFTWTGSHGVVEASDFGRYVKLDSRVYDDACDEGFDLLSVRTGVVLLMTLEREERDADDDVVAWHYVSIGIVEGEWPRRRLIRGRHTDVRVTVLND